MKLVVVMEQMWGGRQGVGWEYPSRHKLKKTNSINMKRPDRVITDH